MNNKSIKVQIVHIFIKHNSGTLPVRIDSRLL